MTNLTPKQEAFVQAYLTTGNASEAYRLAGYSPNASPKTVNEAASRLLADSKINARLSTLREQLAERIMWAREDSVKVLASIAKEEPDAPHPARVSAVKELNAMFGYNAPSKVEHGGTIITTIRRVIVDGKSD